MGELDEQIARLRHGELLSEREVHELCGKARELLLEDANVQRVDAPVCIVGDLHGQLWDTLALLAVSGPPLPQTSFLFLGDIVDRGNHSIETWLLVLSLKVRYPDRVHIIRGNHESRQITHVYGFYDECMRKYGTNSVWRTCTDTFDYLSVAAIVEGSVFCVHGGLSPSLGTLDQIRVLNRKREPPTEGLMCDLLWSDPQEDIDGFDISPRGAGYLFGAAVVEQFCANNNIEFIARAHQLVMEGYKWMFDNKIVTVWSAPNYCYRCGNVASVLHVDAELNTVFTVFEAATQGAEGVPLAKQIIPSYFL
eukprot:TRINITY_DN10539_c0_g4_i2.p1 TRINITY_DN10539_c0_g4~~TRINITY_DN10539_c0_g4_i2.p1  ORF type:complete len:308 (-),score=80.54 TRINITY_DN10539_c0_g4_i2:123-1046(-)